MPQNITKSADRDGTLAGVNASGVYVEIPRYERSDEKPFFHIALNPRHTLKTLEDRLERNGFRNAEWPVTHTPKKWHNATYKQWENAATIPCLAIPSFEPPGQTPDMPRNPVPSFERLKEKGFITPMTAGIIETALEQFAGSNPGEFKTRALEQTLEKLYTSQKTR